MFVSVLHVSPPYERADSIYFGIGNTFRERAGHLVLIYTAYNLSISNFRYFPFWFRRQNIGFNFASSWSLAIFYVSYFHYRDQTCFSVHLHSLGSEGGVGNPRRSPRFSTSPEEPSEC